MPDHSAKKHLAGAGVAAWMGADGTTPAAFSRFPGGPDL